MSSGHEKLINCSGRLYALDRPKVMGILNLTPDSFYDGGKLKDPDTILRQADQMWQEEADILDLGGASSRPGATPVSEQEECDRVIPAISLLRKERPDALISIDTYHAAVAAEALQAGASIVNDISGGNLDTEMFPLLAREKVPYILMHMQGTPATMQDAPHYESVVDEVISFFSKQVNRLRLQGVSDIILDPGFGFGKSLTQNYELLQALPAIKRLGCPVLVGVSRKSMINKVLNTAPSDALNGTTAVHVLALERGADILRVHDVRAAVEAVKIVTFTSQTSC